MPDPRSEQRVHPPLLERLTDKEPAETYEPAYTVAPEEYLEAVRQDLERLLSAKACTEAEEDTGGANVRELLSTRIGRKGQPRRWKYEQARHSVLNYGMPDFRGRAVDAASADELARQMQAAIECFEPRIESPKVRPLATDEEDLHSLGFKITGELRLRPALSFLFRSKLDLETGEHTVGRDATPSE